MKTNLTFFDKLMIAATFAEANEDEPILANETNCNVTLNRKSCRCNKETDTTASVNAIGTKAHA